MDFRDRDGDPLIGWTDPRGAFQAWQACSAGRPCDYTGLSYDALRTASGIPWPGGRQRLYTDAEFPTRPDHCEDYGHDLITGATVPVETYRARRPDGRAFLKAAPYLPAPEQPGERFPLLATTGRTVYHFHTRTKTGRAPRLRDAAPEPWVEMSTSDAAALGVAAGDRVRVESARGAVEAPVRIGQGRPGVVFLPFHYGYWDTDAATHDRAANELTATEWDPVSKQPLFKQSAVRVTRVDG